MTGLAHERRQRLGRFAPVLLWCLVLASSPAAAVDVSAPDTTSGYATTLTLPVALSGVAADTVVAVEVTLTYDTELLTLDDLQSTGLLLENWLLDSLRVDGGQIDTLRVVAATATDTIFAAGNLFKIVFSVADRRAPYTAPVGLSFVLLNEGIPVVNAVSGSVTVVGADGTIVAAADLFETGDLLQVTVSDVDEDRTATEDTVEVGISNGVETEILKAVETAPSSGVFIASIATVFSTGSTSGDDLLQIESGDQIAFCYDDSLDAVGATVQRCTTLVPGHFGVDAVATTTVVVQPQDTVRVRLVDADPNSDAGTAETVQVTASNSTTLESAVITLTETGPDTDIFFGTVFTEFGAVAGAAGDAILNVQKGDSLFVLYSDDATPTGKIAALRDTCVVLDPFGDASANGAAQSFDAALIMDHFVGNITLVALDSLAANVDLQAPFGAITPFDATLVLQHRVGLIDRFPVQEDSSANHPQPETDNSVPKLPLAVRQLTLVAGRGYLAVVVDERQAIVAGHIAVRNFSGRVEPGAGLEDFLVAAGASGAQRRIAFAGARAASGPGELLRLYQDTPGEIQLLEARFNDGRLVGRLAPSGAVRPVHFALHANAPNPFNPETVIRYELPRETVVQLHIYNALGQRIRTLVRGIGQAGAHQIAWDGRDGRGVAAAGGMYFYRLTSADFQATRKMVLLK